MTPAQQVTWSVVGAGIYATHQVRLQYIDRRWGVIPRAEWKDQSPRLLHICRPRTIYWNTKRAYRVITCQYKVPVNKIKGPFKVEVEAQPWRPWISAEKITVTMNGFTVLNHDALAWATEWDCCKLPEGRDTGKELKLIRKFTRTVCRPLDEGSRYGS